MANLRFKSLKKKKKKKIEDARNHDLRIILFGTKKLFYHLFSFGIYSEFISHIVVQEKNSSFTIN